MLPVNKRYTNFNELPLQHQFRCNMCGATVTDKKLHNDFHKSLEAVASDVYGVPVEDM